MTAAVVALLRPRRWTVTRRGRVAVGPLILILIAAVIPRAVPLWADLRLGGGTTLRTGLLWRHLMVLAFVHGDSPRG